VTHLKFEHISQFAGDCKALLHLTYRFLDPYFARTGSVQSSMLGGVEKTIGNGGFKFPGML
jgi:hypothetical protein